jgi:hypothetical protein
MLDVELAIVGGIQNKRADNLKEKDKRKQR